MPQSPEAQIMEAEERLRIAMLNSDVRALNELISPELLFTTHLGQVISKQNDLQSHQSGVIRFQELTPSEWRINMHGPVALVSVLMKVSGYYLGSPFSHRLRYTRVWSNIESAIWRVVGGHISAVQET